jgi:hypothetical protein
MLARKIWHEGFDAGESYRSGCPYLPHTEEADAWHAGWVQGILKRNGCNHHDEPLDFEVRGRAKGFGQH